MEGNPLNIKAPTKTTSNIKEQANNKSPKTKKGFPEPQSS